MMKKTIEKAFNEVRDVIRQKELEFMKLVDTKFLKSLQALNGVHKKSLETKIT